MSNLLEYLGHVLDEGTGDLGVEIVAWANVVPGLKIEVVFQRLRGKTFKCVILALPTKLICELDKFCI